MKTYSREQIEDIIALSPTQAGMLYHHLTETGSNKPYFNQLLLRLEGQLNKSVFERAWTVLIQQNEVMRSAFAWERLEQPVQLIFKEMEFQLAFSDFTPYEPTMETKLLEHLRKDEFKNKIELREAPLFRVHLIKLNMEEHVMLLTNHHILWDGWSTSLLIKELLRQYQQIMSSGKPMLVSKQKWSEFIKLNQKLPDDDERHFWQKYFYGFETKTLIKEQTFGKKEIDSGKVSRYVPVMSYSQLHEIAKFKQSTLASLLYIAWGILLQRYTNQNDVSFGTTVAGRPYQLEGVTDMVGLFINTVPFRFQTSRDSTMDIMVAQVKDSLLARKEFECTPLVDILNYIDLKDSHDLFNSIVVVENYPVEFPTIDSDLRVSGYESFEETNYDLTLVIMEEKGKKMKIELCYNKNKFTEFFVVRMLDHYIGILNSISDGVNKTLSGIEMMTHQEKVELLEMSASRPVPYQAQKTIPALFMDQVQKYPTQIAIVDDTRKFTYEQTDKLSNILAAKLIKCGIKPNQPVGVYMNRSAEMIIALLAVLKAGAPYVPIDPSYPEERRRYLLENCRADLILYGHDLLPFDGCAGLIVDISMFDSFEEEETPVHLANPHDLAYVIYTSGSTGVPKGVMVEHKSIVNTLSWRINHYGFSPKDTVLQLPSFSFDSAVEDIFTTLLSGAKLVLLSEYQKIDTESLGVIMGREGVTHFLCVPTYYQVLLDTIPDCLDGLRFVTVAGEECPTALVNKHFSLLPHVKLYNEYGPTENSVCTTVQQLTSDSMTIPIGKPIANTECYVLSITGSLQPVGVAGELHISGSGLARGYLNNSKETSQRFFTDPISSKRFYKSGDIVRWLPGGYLEFIGRLDHQVKIKGFRIELGEVEKTIRSHPDVTGATVLIQSSSAGENYLSAYVIPRQHGLLDEVQVIEHLEKSLPDYMIPKNYIFIAQLPLTANGKIDRSKLEEIFPEPTLEPTYVSPQSEIEKKLVALWGQLLNRESIGVTEKFFEVGGDSLKIMRLTHLINREFNENLHVPDLFKFTTIQQIATFLKEKMALTDSVEDEITLFTY